MTDPIEIRALRQVVENYLQADSEWLSKQSDTDVSYWFSRFETRITSDLNEDGSVKLRSRTILVEKVVDENHAIEVCEALNMISPSWAFVYSASSGCIEALSSVVIYVHEQDGPPTFRGWEPPPFQDAWMILFAMAIWGAATLSEELADLVAEMVGGRAAVSKPENQTQPRNIPDVFSLLPDVLRQRPEWLKDYKPFVSWPHPGEFATSVGSALREQVDESFVTALEDSDDLVVLSIARGGTPVSIWGFDTLFDPRYGVCSVTRTQFGRPDRRENADNSNLANQIMWNLPNSTQLGSWQTYQNGMFYTQAIPSAHLRSLEDSAGTYALNNYNSVFFERLAVRAAGVFECIQELLFEAGLPYSGKGESEHLKDIRQALDGQLVSAAHELLEETVNADGVSISDPKILRLTSGEHLFVLGIMNPYGPTVTSVELIEYRGQSYFAEIQRHPFFPVYSLESAAPLGSPKFLDQVQKLIKKNVQYLPSYLELSNCPKVILDVVKELLLAHFEMLAQEQMINILALTQRLRSTVENPWERIAHELPELEAATNTPTQAQIEEFFELITSQENLVPFWMEVPNAWDGAINVNLNTGLLENSDIGLLVWRYNHKIGSSA